MRLLSSLVGALVGRRAGGGMRRWLGSSTGEGGEARLSHTEWVSQADAICSVDHEANASRKANSKRWWKAG